jgi:hypothetical protein
MLNNITLYVAGEERRAPIFDYLCAGRLLLPPPPDWSGIPSESRAAGVLDDLPAVPPDFAEVVTAALRAKGRDVWSVEVLNARR